MRVLRTRSACCAINGSSDRVKKPCATVVPNGPLPARSGSTWIHWSSPLASAKRSMRPWSTVIQSLMATSWPTSGSSSAIELNSRMTPLTYHTASAARRPAARGSRGGRRPGTVSPHTDGLIVRATHPQNQSDILDVLIVGAGLSGIGAARHLLKRCPGKRYAILEARDCIGGTWDLFRYPG